MSTREEGEGLATDNRRQGSGSRVICRTCRNCRRKKIRCDGHNPKCRSCRSKELECEYPPDARKSAVRSKTRNVGLLQKEIDELRTRLRESTGADTSDVVSVTANPSLNRTLANLRDSSAPSSGQDANASIRPVILEGHSYGAQRRNHNPAYLSHPEHNQDREDFQVYGATSLLYDPSSQPFLWCQRDRPDVDESEKVAARDHLISFAAIRRQEENVLYATPSVMTNVDFDGVSVDMAMHLINLHWRHQHLTYLITYRPAIMDSIFHNGPYVSKLLLNAIYLSSSLYSERTNSRSSSESCQSTQASFYDRFKALLGQNIDQPSIPTVVGLLIGGACLVSHGKQRAGWVYCGIAYRMLIDLGCHLDIPAGTKEITVPKLTKVDVELRRRVFWGAYVGEKFQCLFLGRSPTLEQSVGNISNEYLDTYEELEEWTPYVDHTLPLNAAVPAYTSRPSYAISTFQSLLRLSMITSRIIHTFYSVNSWKSPLSALIQTADDIKNELRQWRSSLLPHLLFDCAENSTPPPHQLTPHTTYWTLVILIEQPFLNKNQYGGSIAETLQNASKQRCIEAAQNICKILKAYRRAFTLRRAQYGISYAAYCAVFALLQYTEEDSEEHLESIRFFWSALLEFQKGLSSGLKRPLRLLRSLMLRLRRVSQACGTSLEDFESVDTVLPCQQVHTGFNDELPPVVSLTNNTLVSRSTLDPDSDPWPDLWPDALDGSTEVIDDNMFGFFMQI